MVGCTHVCGRVGNSINRIPAFFPSGCVVTLCVILIGGGMTGMHSRALPGKFSVSRWSVVDIGTSGKCAKSSASSFSLGQWSWEYEEEFGGQWGMVCVVGVLWCKMNVRIC